MAIQFMGFPTTLGLPRQAARHAPEALRTAGLLGELRQITAAVDDLGDLPLDQGDRSLPVPDQVQRVVSAASEQADHWLRMYKPGSMMLTAGGDHSTSLGTMWALTRMGHSFDVVWIDAHGDFNVIETSPSGNVHGMVLALACGLMPSYLPPLVAPSSLRLWGIRDLDPGEQHLLARERIEVLSPDQTRHEWDRIVRRLQPHIFLSFDIDSVDPGEAPGTMTPVPGGFRRQEALEMVAYLARHRKILALDVVELHPDHDRNDVTVDLGVRIATTAASGQVEQSGGRGLGAAAGS